MINWNVNEDNGITAKQMGCYLRVSINTEKIKYVSTFLGTSNIFLFIEKVPGCGMLEYGYYREDLTYLDMFRYV